MKKPLLSKLFNGLLMGLAGLGIIFSIAAVVILWMGKKPVLAVINSTLTLIIQTTDNMDATLLLINESLNNASETLTQVDATLQTTITTFDAVAPALNTTADIIGIDLSNVVLDTQTALVSASSSAKFIDDTLKIMASVPFIGVNYQPAMPLETSLLNVSTSLDDLPETFTEIQNDLEQTATNAELIKADMESIATAMDTFNQRLLDVNLIIADYQLQLETFQSLIHQIQSNVNTGITVLLVGFSGIFFWLALAQFGLILFCFKDLKSDIQVIKLSP